MSILGDMIFLHTAIKGTTFSAACQYFKQNKKLPRELNGGRKRSRTSDFYNVNVAL